MSARDIVGGLAGAAVGAVKHPVGTAGEAISKAKGAVSAGTAVGTAVAGSVVGRVRGGAGEARSKAADATKDTAAKTAVKAKQAHEDPAGTVKQTAAEVTGTAKSAVTKVAAKSAAARKSSTDKAPAKKSPAKKSPARKSPAKATKKAPAKREPQVVLAEPTLPVEPPIDVVGEALAAEAQNDPGAGRATEPRGASRDEEHGEAALQRAEAAEIIEEIAEASEVGQVDVETPVGTTGADVANNPDTAEADLQQPGTEPLMDPSLTKTVKAEQETLTKAAAPRKPRPKKKA